VSILDVRDLVSGYGDVRVLSGVTLSLQEGELTALVGSNGEGKTTLLRTVMGAIRPTSGSVHFMGKDVGSLPPHAKAEMGLVLVPEGRQVFATMSVAENLAMGATPRRARPHARRNLERVYELFPRLRERRDQKAGTLSGGEQQMLAVARGIMAEPLLLMIDELSMGLAPSVALQLFETLTTLKGSGLTVLLVEQNVRMALVICEHAYVLSQGRIELQGPSRALIQNEQIRAAYLGLGDTCP